MPNYQKLYTKMFNAATDAIAALEDLNIGYAKNLLRRAQQDAEAEYIEEDSTSPISETKQPRVSGKTARCPK